ncbi:helix-turn-helix domain-containing protein [Candidatus Saccharibacteria bacterium]|nr:helix-turn-helix domain-containing protein [Candidatus Saccharibacteria bacterium]
MDQIRNNGISVSEAANKYNVTSRTIYGWLRANVVDGNKNLILENNRLKKELEQAYKVLRRLTAESQRPKG